MNASNVDLTLLRELAGAAVHAGRQAIVHNEAEVVGDVDGLLDTLAADEPYAYMLMPDFQPDGSIRLPVQTTRDEVRAVYEIVRGRSDVLSEEPILEIRTPWYAFWESVSSGRNKETGAHSENPLAILSPAGRAKGITGEIIWPKLASRRFGTGTGSAEAADAFSLRRDQRDQHLRHLRSLERADVDGLLAGFDDGAASAVRDYVSDSGTLIELHGRDGHRAYWDALFARYEVISVELLHRVAQEWYLFSEIRVTVRSRDDAKGRHDWAFHTAEIHAPAKDGRVLACLGWGTDLAPARPSGSGPVEAERRSPVDDAEEDA